MPAKKRRLYLDTSVLGFAVNRRAPSRRAEANRLLHQIREGRFVGGLSFVTEAEIRAAPPPIAARLKKIVTWSGLRRIRLSARGPIYDLAHRYCQAGAIPQEYFEDALHVAVATTWKAHALVSFNFAHLVRLETMVRVNAINRSAGLAEIFICQPSEVILP